MRKFVAQHVEGTPTKKPKKITGTRLSSILGFDRWNTEFKTWCAITRTYEEPFVDTIYTNAGKVIEPKVDAYLNKTRFFGKLKTPEDIFGKDFFKKTFGDFYHDVPIFGGMWDALVYENGKPTTVIEIKTTKRAEDWRDGPPIYYAVQASLYAYLLGLDDVIMVCAFLEPEDYEHPELFEPSIDNTITYPFKVSEMFPRFEEYIDNAKAWWNAYVKTGVSPDFDPKKDKEILDALRTTVMPAHASASELISKAESLSSAISSARTREKLDELEADYKAVCDQIKEIMSGEFKESDTKVTIDGATSRWVLTRSERTAIDKKALEADGVLAKYTTVSTTLTLKPQAIKEEK